MVVNAFHFETPTWLWGLALIPFMGGGYKLLLAGRLGTAYLEAFIDKALLPHLLVGRGKRQGSLWRSFALWSLLWGLLMGALANPRWDYKEVTAFIPDQSVCILLDVSRSMDAQDVKPSRMARARQKIEDLIEKSVGMKVGLVAYAADPHMIAPLTDDKETLLHLLPSLDTDLAYVQGSRLAPALTMASRLLEAAPGHNKSIVLLTDGGFEDQEAIALAQELSRGGTSLYILGIGTEEGAPIPDGKGNLMKTKRGETLIAKLNSARLHELTQGGKGQLWIAQALDQDIRGLVKAIRARSKADERTEQQTRQWHDRYYFFVFPMLLLMLLWFRRGSVFPLVLMGMVVVTSGAQAFDIIDLFRNKDQQGQAALTEGKYEQAREKFSDPYRQGVASYRAGDYAEAEKLFQLPQREESAVDALYNLGNTLALQSKLEEAVKAYESVLERDPAHAKAKHNLEIVKKLLEQKKEEQKQDKPEDQKPQDQEKDKDKDQGKDKKPKQDKSGKENSPEDKSQKGNQDASPSDEKKPDNGKSEDNQSSSKPKTDSKNPSDSQPEEKESGDSEGEEDKKNSPEQNAEGKEDSEKTPPKQEKGQEPSQKEAEKPSGGTSQEQQEQEAGAQKQESPQEGVPSSPSSLGEQSPPEEKTISAARRPKTQEDIDADQWLNQISTDSKSFLKNQFYIESHTQGTQQGMDPW